MASPIFHFRNALHGANILAPILANSLNKEVTLYDSISITDLNNLTKSTSLEFDLESTQQMARDHFKDFVRDEILFARDYQDLRVTQSLHSLIVNKQSKYIYDKFNLERWERTFSKDSLLPGDSSRLYELASSGSTLGVPNNFVPLYYPPPMRHQYIALGNTFTAHVQSLLEKGRFCIDPTNAPKGYIGLNTPETLDIAIDKYLPTNLPTIQSLITNQILNVASKFRCSISDLTLYKSDINSAFYTTIVNPKDAPLGGVRISEKEFMIHISGSFGLNSQPLVFNLLGRNFNYKVNQVISGAADTYIDDTCGSTIDHQKAFLLYTWSTITTGYTFNNISHSPGAGDVIRDSDILSRNPHYRHTELGGITFYDSVTL